MAINSNGVLRNTTPCRSLCSSKTSNLSSCRLIKINFAEKDSCCSSRANRPHNNKDTKSPYTNDKVQLLSRVPEKKVINKKPTELFSSFPLAASVYKANSDEFKFKRKVNKKVKKSVLTLPNEPSPMPKTYTVSDLNDSEYFNNSPNETRAIKHKKRRSVKRSKKPRVKEHAMELYDRDTRYCSRLNTDLDCSSSEVVNYTGDGERVSRVTYKSNNSGKSANNPHDVWAVLRNLKKIQFIPSLASQESIAPLRKRRPMIRKINNSKDTRFIETCHTEEFAYISSYEVDGKTHESCSPSSSFDRVTVIDKQSEQEEIMKQFSRNIFGFNVNNKIKSNNNEIRGRTKQRIKNNKKVSNAQKTDNNNALTNKTIKKSLQLGEDIITNYNNQCLGITKPFENSRCSEICSIKENDTLSNGETNTFQEADPFYDQYNKRQSMSRSNNTEVNMLKTIDNTEKQLTGITKVTFNKGQEIVSSKLALAQRKPRLALTLPNANGPKLSQLDIKRRLANLKFPIVVLGKDQITNRGISISNTGFSQFDGLNNHIWPFMLEWFEKNRSDCNNTVTEKEENVNYIIGSSIKLDHKENSSNYHLVLNKDDESKKNKKCTISTVHNSTKSANVASSQIAAIRKPFNILKNKMFQFLNKKTEPSGNVWTNNRRVETAQKDKRVGTTEITKNVNELGKICSQISVSQKGATDKHAEYKIVKKSYSSLEYQWAKGKWANDFIENIIMKIRNGVYYSVDRKQNKYRTDGTEVSTQTEVNASKNACCQNGIDIDLVSTPTFKNYDTLKSIPGFDKTLKTLEIEAISTNKIAVKHCTTNVVVQFDVQVLGEIKNVTHSKKSMSCIPLNLRDNHEKVFKCNTRIINATLPAELCSIIPIMMQTILGTENTLIPQPVTYENVHTYLIPKSEFKESESVPVIASDIPVLPECSGSDKITSMLNGRFSNGIIKSGTHIPLKEMSSIVTSFPPVNIRVLCDFTKVTLHVSASNINISNTLTGQPNRNSKRSMISSMALQLYEPRNHCITPFKGYFNVFNFMKQIVNRVNVKWVNKNIIITCHELAYNKRNISINRPLLYKQSEDQNVLSLSSCGKLGVISLFNAFKKNNLYDRNANDLKRVYNIETDSEKKKQNNITNNESKTALRKKLQPNKVLRKKSYVRCYRKCNSMSSIANVKCTPLDRVNNLEEFCQVLGSNVFCSVLDECLEKKVLGAVDEVKNWITDISPKQALLILLLTNKKDTPNLIRFRPVLLQGIAVNRITKAVELDTEIEVIERENFHKISQCEGISYLPASTKIQDNLLEELCWIAKTTASDYQKTYDESSEKLLKSLLEKRKKLNPSYLRVMARYVGLGLLAPTKL